MYLQNLIKQIIPESIKKDIKKDIKKIKIYKNKIKLLKGRKIDLNSNKKSLLFFTMHKTASTYMKKCMKYLNKKYLGLVHADLESYIWNYSDKNVYQILKEKKSIIFHPKGILYAPLRMYIPIDKIDHYCIVLMLRDPRDVLVSSYYSKAYSHGLPIDKKRKKTFVEIRNQTKQQTIDEYTIANADYLYQRYSDYCNYLIKEQNIKYLRYEDFIQNYDLWINQLEEILNIEITKKDKNALFELKGGDAPTVENKLKHIRKATPGDYKEKLTEKTQELLNSKFKDILLTLNYK